MSFLKKASLVSLAFAMLSVSGVQSARAEGFALQDWSARGAALAGGIVARGGDASAVAYNPAAITELEGTQIMAGGEIISLFNTIVMKNGTNDRSEGKLYFAPHGYVTHKLNDSVSLGLGIYSRYGLGNDHGNWAGGTAMRHIELLTSSVTPVIAYKVTDKLSVAAGLEIMGGIVEYDTKDMNLKGDAVDFGYNLSAHYRFNEQWKAGFTYRSHVTLGFDGDMKLNANGAKFPGEADLHTPDSYTLALAYYPTEKLSFEGQVQYNTWSRYHSLVINHGAPFPSSPIVQIKNWDDTWLFSLSAEYDWNEWLTLRAGASYETSPVDPKYADFIAPVNGRWKYAAGFGVHKNNWTVDVSYVYHDISNLYYDQSSLAGTMLGASQTRDVHAHTLGFSFGYKF